MRKSRARTPNKILVSFILWLSVLSGSTGSLAYTIEPGHPRLYFTTADLSGLRQRTTTTHATQWQALLNWNQSRKNEFGKYAGRDPKLTHRYIERNAFMYLMLQTSNPSQATQYAQIAKDWIMELARYEFTGSPSDAFEYLWALAIGYDWLYNWQGFSAADKQKVRDQLIQHTKPFWKKTGLKGFKQPPTGPGRGKRIYHNMSTETNMVNAFVGLALWEADDRYLTNEFAQKFIDAAYARFQEMYLATHTYCPDGGFWEGQGYAGARLQGEVYFAYTWKVATGEDLFASNDHMRNAIFYWIYNLRPDGVSTREGDTTCLPAGCDRNRLTAEIIADRYQDGYAQWYAQYQGAIAGKDWEDIVFYNPAIPAKDPSTLPLYRNFRVGRIVIRTGWTIDQESLDTMLAFNIHDWTSGHVHLDNNSFTFYRKGALAIDSGQYRGSDKIARQHERNYAIRSIAHNTILVYNPREDFGKGFSNDGGQEFLYKERKRPKKGARYIADLQDGTRFDTATLEKFEPGPDYYYIKGNATDAYHSTGYNAKPDGKRDRKISHFTRELVFFPGAPYPILVVFDRVISLDANYPKKWLLHFIDEPAIIDGSLVETEVTGHITRYQATLLSMTRTNPPHTGKLFSKTLLPSPATIRKVGGKGYEFWVDDPRKNYPLSSDPGEDAESGAWRVEVQPVTLAEEDVFLHALYATDSEISSMPPTSLVVTDNMYGAHIEHKVIMFSKGVVQVSEVNYSISDSVPVSHIITGLNPGTYKVTRNGSLLGSFSTSTAGILSFDSPAGGLFAINPSTD